MAVWSSLIVAPHGSPSGVAATRAILAHANCDMRTHARLGRRGPSPATACRAARPFVCAPRPAGPQPRVGLPRRTTLRMRASAGGAPAPRRPAARTTSALRRFAKLRLDLVAGLHVLQRFAVGLKFVSGAVLLANRDAAAALIDGEDLPLHLLGRLRAGLAVGLRLTERESRRQHGGRREHTREHVPALHRIHPLSAVRAICCAWRCRTSRRRPPRRP